MLTTTHFVKSQVRFHMVLYSVAPIWVFTDNPICQYWLASITRYLQLIQLLIFLAFRCVDGSMLGTLIEIQEKQSLSSIKRAPNICKLSQTNSRYARQCPIPIADPIIGATLVLYVVIVVAENALFKSSGVICWSLFSLPDELPVNTSRSLWASDYTYLSTNPYRFSYTNNATLKKM